ncbi:MAG: hypothetical protein AAGM38_17890, partial [Pseudomonadota bacterium]
RARAAVGAITAGVAATNAIPSAVRLVTSPIVFSLSLFILDVLVGRRGAETSSAPNSARERAEPQGLDRRKRA